MGRCMAWYLGAWSGDDAVGLGEMQWYTTWIGEVGLGQWGEAWFWVMLVMVRRDLVGYQNMKWEIYFCLGGCLLEGERCIFRDP